MEKVNVDFAIFAKETIARDAIKGSTVLYVMKRCARSALVCSNVKSVERNIVSLAPVIIQRRNVVV